MRKWERTLYTKSKRLSFPGVPITVFQVPSPIIILFKFMCWNGFEKETKMFLPINILGNHHSVVSTYLFQVIHAFLNRKIDKFQPGVCGNHELYFIDYYYCIKTLTRLMYLDGFEAEDLQSHIQH